MAQRINLRESEYQIIMTELTKMHADHLRNVSSVIGEMKTLVNSEDIFSADLTSQKMTEMLDLLASDVMTLLQQAFWDSEAGVANMMASSMITDSACG